MSSRGKFYRAAEQYARQAFISSPRTFRHLQRTADYAEQIRPDADEAMLVAAVLHDIERSDPPGRRPPDRGLTDKVFDKHHQERGAEMAMDFLQKQGAKKNFIERVGHLIRRHELGGDADQDLIKDADSMSFLEIQIDHFLTDKIPAYGWQDVYDKFFWMFDRISSEQGKQIAEPYYQTAMKRLETLKL